MWVYAICYLAAFLADRAGWHWPAGLCLMAAAVWLYLTEYGRTGNLVHLRGLFSLFWVGGQGIACLKLSRLQVPWSGLTWACFFLAFAGFFLTFEVLERREGGREGMDAGPRGRRLRAGRQRRNGRRSSGTEAPGRRQGHFPWKWFRGQASWRNAGGRAFWQPDGRHGRVFGGILL